MAKPQIADFKGNVIVADAFVGDIDVEVDAGSVTVAAGTDGLSAGDVQAALQSLATRVQALEDA